MQNHEAFNPILVHFIFNSQKSQLLLNVYYDAYPYCVCMLCGWVDGGRTNCLAWPHPKNIVYPINERGQSSAMIKTWLESNPVPPPVD